MLVAAPAELPPLTVAVDEVGVGAGALGCPPRVIVCLLDLIGIIVLAPFIRHKWTYFHSPLAIILVRRSLAILTACCESFANTRAIRQSGMFFP